MVTPRTPPPSQGKGAEGPKPGFGYGGRASDYKSAHKGLKGHDAQGTLSRIFKLSNSPAATSADSSSKQAITSLPTSNYDQSPDR
ncbi:Myelin basic protein, partial [Eschrichtius robustus]|nr:Myelin basic protein [Eschrichtius robustus]